MKIKIDNEKKGFVIYLSDGKDFIEHIGWDSSDVLINQKTVEIIETSLRILFEQYLRRLNYGKENNLA